MNGHARILVKKSPERESTIVKLGSEVHDIDCKTVRIFAYSSTREQSNKRSTMRLKTESETGEFSRLARFARVRLLRHALPISLLILRKKPTVLQSKMMVSVLNKNYKAFF